MKLAQISVNRPVTTAMIFTAMIVLGLRSMSMLGLDLMPELEIPAVSVSTVRSLLPIIRYLNCSKQVLTRTGSIASFMIIIRRNV